MNVQELFSLRGRVAVVTGGSRGIGFMIATGLVASGARTYITARNAEACERAADQLRELGECRSIPADLSSSSEITHFVAELERNEPHVDILVNNAGTTWGAPLGEFPEHGVDKVLTVNLKAPFLLTQALLPMLTARASADEPSRVVIIGSVDGIAVPTTPNFSYSASKAGVHMLARHLAHVLAERHVTVNALAPGPFESKMMSYRVDDPEQRRELEDAVALGRIGRPEDIAGATIFLCSRAGAYLTGAVLPVDGGLSTHG